MERVINGKMTKKLLHKTLNYYFVYALVVLLSIGPSFYLISSFLFENDADEDLLVLKDNFTNHTLGKLKEKDIVSWNNFSHDMKIEKANGKVKDTLFDFNFYDSVNKEVEPFRILESPIQIEGKAYTFSARMNMVGKENLVFSTVTLFISLLLLLFLGFFIITKIISKTIWNPFYVALDRIERFEIDKETDIELIASSTEEFERLNHALQNLIQKNRIIFQSQREFIENAAHELQTPIAIFKGKIETLLQRTDLNDEQFELLDKLNERTARFGKLNRNLLLLSKLDSKQYVVDEEVVLNDTILHQSDFFKEQALSKNITITLHLENDVLKKTNQSLFEILVSNLFLNAINHNIENGTIQVALNNHSLSFSNTGSWKPLNSATLFERFAKIDPSSKGNGLGLSIVKKIVDLNHWRIEYGFENGQHNFTLHF